ncbi:unnamed protein product, partial [Didymodactylos carnosus]
QGIGFYGIDTQLVDLLNKYKLENIINILLANGINDLETLHEKRDEVMNSTHFIDINQHFQFKKLIESIKTPVLMYLEWLNFPQSRAIAGEKLQTFSVVANENITDRVRLEEKSKQQ